jgi:tetratricopeptide (TPR) repeat protein
MLKMMPLPSRARFLSLAVMSWLLAGPARADSFPSWYAKARKAEARHDYDAALQAWSNALHLWKSTDSKPKKTQALAARAALYEKKGELQAALRDLSAALKLKTKDAVLFHRRGVLYLERGEAPKAISDFYKATALKLDYSEAFFDRGRAYESQGDAQFSKEDFRTACHLGLKKACAKAAPSKVTAKSKGTGKSAAHAAAPPPAVQTSSAPSPMTAVAIPHATGSQTAPPSATAKASASRSAPAETPAGSAAQELPIGKTAGGEKAATPPMTTNSSSEGSQDGAAAAPPPDFSLCISRIHSCSESGNSYSACVSRARLCERYPKEGCCPRDCVLLFQKLLDSKSEAEAFREAFAPDSACLSVKKSKSDEVLEDSAP